VTRAAALLVLLLAPAAVADPLSDARTALAHFRREPSVARVQRAAIRAARIEPAEADSWRDRVNVAALLPELRLRAYHTLDRDESLGLEPGSPDRFDLDAGVGWIFEARAQWELSRLVWDPDEVNVGKEAAARGESRNDLVQAVTRLYFERRRRQVARLLRPPATAAEAAEAEIAIEEMTAALDGLTGGGYRAALGVSR